MQSPFVLVLFGATGDLAQHKLVPALFHLFQKNQLPKDFFIYGFARREMSDAAFAAFFLEYSAHPAWKEFVKHLSYQQGLFDEEKGYQALVKRLQDVDKHTGACITRIFYLATPPSNYDAILDNLVSSQLSEGCGQGSSKWTRIAIEKPFGKDVQTARVLDEKLGKIFQERQIFRVDHYLGKETLQNLLVFRFANGIFDPIWNNQYLDHVQITWAEKKSIDGRGNFFDGVGMLRDVGQNHLMQLIAAVSQDMPKSFSQEGVRDARAKAIQDIACIQPQDVSSRVVRGQYKGYLSEKGVAQDSQTETFVAMQFFVDSPRFAHVPFYVRAGKALKKDVAEIHLVFKQTCHMLFKEIGCPEDGNVLTIRIQPNEGIRLKIIAKTPGAHLALQAADMHFTYKEQFGTSGIDAYEKVLSDIIAGEQMLFNRSDELEASWQFIEKILQGWQEEKEPVLSYAVGSMGPQKAAALIEKDGRKWIE